MATEDSERLKSLIGDVKERLYKLKFFDCEYEINAYCDHLLEQIYLAVESAIRDINNLQEKLLDRVASYREGRLRRLANPNERARQSIKLKDEKLKRDLDNLQKEVDEFSKSCASHLEQIDAAKQEADTLTSKINCLEIKIRKHAFGGQFMRFNQNNLLAMNTDLIGKFQIYSRDLVTNARSPGVEMKYELSVSEPGSWTSMSFLQNGDLAVTDKTDRIIRIWDPVKKRVKHTIPVEKEDIPFSFAKLKGGCIAIGKSSGLINIWDLEKNTLLKTLNRKMHRTGAIGSLIVLKNNFLSSLSHYGDLRIWNPYVDEQKSFIRRMSVLPPKVPGHPRYTYMHGILSNGFLVTGCCEGFIKVWDPSKGHLVLSFETNVSILHFIVLSDDDILVNGVKRYNLVQKSLVWQINPEVCTNSFAFELENGCLLAKYFCSSINYLTLWSKNATKNSSVSLQKLDFFRNEKIYRYNLSRNGKSLVYLGTDGVVRIWKLTF